MVEKGLGRWIRRGGFPSMLECLGQCEIKKIACSL